MKTKNRESNIELLRIVLILMVITLHYCNGTMGGLLNNAETGSLNYYLSHFFESLCIDAVNVFIIITGYFSYKKDSVDVNKTFKLFGLMTFYGLVLSLPFFVSQNNYSIGAIYKLLQVIFSQWFVIIYIILYLLIPYMVDYRMKLATQLVVNKKRHSA